MKKAVFLILALLVPGSLLAALMTADGDPVQGLSDNIILDIISHQNGIWVRNNEGISYTDDNGVNWYYYDSTNGLISNSAAAIFSSGERLWVSLLPPEGEPDGNYLAWTEDDGYTWDTVMVDTAYVYTNPVFDIDGFDSLVVFASKVGGLFASFDTGQTWRNIYYSIADSLYKNSDIQYTNHYFSVVVDTFHQDSTLIWAGTANGLFRYTYAADYAKPSSNYIFSLTHANGYIYICGDSGLSRFRFQDGFEVFFSSFESSGLPGTAVTAAHYHDGRLMVGTLDSLGGEGTGLAISDDNGETFHTGYTGLDDMFGENKYAVEMVSVDDCIFLAGYEAGLFKSIDDGNSWEKVPLDPGVDSKLNIVHSLAEDSAYLWVGTDSGLVRLLLDLDNDAAIVEDTNIYFGDTEYTGARSYKVRVQHHYGDDDIVDSTTVWTILHPLDEEVGEYAVFYSWDYGANWTTNTSYIVGPKHYDIAFLGSSVYITGNGAFRFAQNRYNWFTKPGNEISDSSGRTFQTFEGLAMTDIEIINDTFYVASEHGLAISPPGSYYWSVIVADSDPYHYYTVNRYMDAEDTGGLAGTFVIALDIQNIAGGDNLIWASSRVGANSAGSDGIAVSALDGLSWEVKYTGSPCWNMDFYESSVFAASDAGLLFSADEGDTWDTLAISGMLINYPRPVEFDIEPGKGVYSVLVYSDTLWVGTEEGLASIPVDSLGQDIWRINRVYDPSQDVYAYPVPFSPYDDISRVTFHYPVPQDAEATIEVFDFAMNLVKKVIDGQWKPGGEDIISSVDRWDGKNDMGDYVAAGIYYFKITLSTGEEYWGKLAVSP